MCPLGGRIVMEIHGGFSLCCGRYHGHIHVAQILIQRLEMCSFFQSLLLLHLCYKYHDSFNVVFKRVRFQFNSQILFLFTTYWYRMKVISLFWQNMKRNLRWCGKLDMPQPSCLTGFLSVSVSFCMLLLFVSATTNAAAVICQKDWKGSEHIVHLRWHWLTLKRDVFITVDLNCSLGKCQAQPWHLRELLQRQRQSSVSNK